MQTTDAAEYDDDAGEWVPVRFGALGCVVGAVAGAVVLFFWAAAIRLGWESMR